MIENLLRLYPASYRRAHGGEIAAALREATAGEPLGSRLREGAGLAAHATRMRAGLGSSSPGAQLLAEAYPFALAASAAVCGLHLVRRYAGMVASPTPLRVQLGVDLAGSWGVMILSSLVVFAGVASALAGRWRAGVPCTVAGLLCFAAAAVVSGPVFDDPLVTPASMVLAAAVVLACPPDLRPEGAATGRAAAAGAVVALAVVPRAVIDAQLVPWVGTDHGCWPLLVLAATGVVLTWRGARAGLQLGAMALASPPLLAQARTTLVGDAVAVLCLVAVLPVAAVGAFLAGRPRRSGRAVR